VVQQISPHLATKYNKYQVRVDTNFHEKETGVETGKLALSAEGTMQTSIPCSMRELREVINHPTYSIKKIVLIGRAIGNKSVKPLNLRRIFKTLSVSHPLLQPYHIKAGLRIASRPYI
jgi:hypothetical protein